MPVAASLPTSFGETFDRPAVFFGWSPREIELGWPFELQLGGHGFSFARACFSFFIEDLGFGCGATIFGKAYDDDGPFIRPTADTEMIADPNDSTGLGAAVVDFDFAAGHGLSGR